MKKTGKGNPAYSVNQTANTVTYTWQIEVGLMNGNTMITDASAYTRDGRDAVTSLTLKDTLDALLNKDNSHPNPSSVTIQKDGTGTTPVTLTSGNDILVWGDGADQDLRLNSGYYLDADGDKRTDGAQDPEAPLYTSYTVTATYDITEMYAEFYATEGYKLTSDNRVDMTALLANKEPQESHGAFSIEAPLPRKKPAGFTVAKYLQPGNGGAQVVYDNAKYGPVTYTVSDGTSAPTLYTKSGDTYTEFTGTIVPGTTYYFLPGTYTVTESIQAAHANDMKFVSATAKSGTKEETGAYSAVEFTAAQNETWNVTFTNKECRGEIKITKKDGFDTDAQPLAGAKFQLKDSAGRIIKVGDKDYAETNASGYVAYTDLPFGTYTLTEIEAPVGFTKNDDENDLPMTIVIGDGTGEKQIHELTFGNDETKGQIILTKYVGYAQSSVSGFQQVTGTTNFATFELQRSTDGVNWETATDYKGNAVTQSLNAQGQITVEVPAKSQSGQPYQYRFKETITDTANYYPVVENPTGTFTNKPNETVSITPAQTVEAGGTANFKMYNRRLLKINVSKNFYTFNANGARTAESGKTATVTLYRSVGTPSSASDLEQVGESKQAGSTAASWGELPAYGPNGAYTYYIKETPVDGYNLDTATNNQDGSFVKIGNDWYVKITFNTTNTSTKTTYLTLLYNYRQAIPVHIRKQNALTNAYNISGCKVTIYTDAACTQVAYDALTPTKKLENLSMPTGTTGTTFFLKEGQKYYYKETDLNGYVFVNLTTDSGISPTTTNYGVIDLTNVTQPGLYNQSTKYKAYTVKNKPAPQVKITKKTMGQQTEIKGAKFTVYYKNASGQYVPYPNATNPVVFDLTSANNATKTLPMGTYYIAETTVPEGYLNPNSANGAAEYNRVADILHRYLEGTTPITYTYDPTTGLTFTQITVDGDTENFTFYNILNKEKVRVKKRVDGQEASVAGFMVYIYNERTSPITQVGNGVMTNKNGVAEFYDVPIYDANGNRITYTVREGDPASWEGGATGTLAGKYYKTGDGQQFQLEVQTSNDYFNDKDLNGNTLYVDNATYIKVSATKYQQDGWQWSHGGMRFPMDGVTIGLYRRVAGSTNWTKVADGTTSNGGQISFDKLPRTDANGVAYEYAMVELASNSNEYFPYDTENRSFKDYPASPANVLTDLSNYNALILNSTSIVTTKTEYELGEMTNSNHWVQFHVTKWLDVNSRPQNRAAGIGDSTGHRRWPEDRLPGEPDTLLSDCVYSLYRYILSDTQETVAFDREGEGWVRIGTYTSGSLLDPDGNPLEGQFLTDLDTGINDNYVYVLVEDNVGPNSAIPNPYYEYTFWYSKNRTTVPTCTVDGSPIDRRFDYTMDQQNATHVLNSWDEGPGDGNILLAALRLTKWYDEYDANGNRKQEYKPLNNVQFEVKLADGTVIAEMTTGLDGNTDVAMAQSGTYQLVLGTKAEPNKIFLYEYEVPEAQARTFDVTDSIVHFNDPDHPTYDIYGIPVNVYETGAPAGYGYMLSGYQTYLIFVDKNPGGTGGKFRFYSDLYFVNTTDKTIHLAESQSGRLWHFTEAGGTYSFGDVLQRIVDYPITNTPVEINKVGYAPTKATMELANADTTGANYSEEIATGNYGAVPLQGVTMTLERYDETAKQWKSWNYENDSWTSKTFTTDELGNYYFRNGLPKGKYRVYETSLGDNATEYENAYLKADGHYREFTVGGTPVLVYMANPEKIDLTITKKNLANNNAVSGMTFKLGGLTATEEPANSGIYKFTNVATGTYKLTETGPSSISTKYFASMFAAQYPALAALVGDDGMKLGYTYTAKGGDGAKDVSITAATPWSTADSGILQLDIKNPPKTNIQLKKVDLDNNSKALSASFEMFYLPFSAVSGDINVTLPTIADGTSLANVRTAFTNAGWTDVSNNSVGTDGKTFENQEPGIYAFYENSAPTGYDRLIVDNKVVIYTAVVTGGMDVNVTVDPSSVTVGTKTVTTNFSSTDGTQVTVTAQDPRKATLKAKKSVNIGDLQGSDVINWSVTLNLYDAATGGNLVGTATIGKGDNQNDIKFKNGNSDAYFSVGKTYYLEEVINTPDASYADAAHFIWVSYQLGNGTAIPVTPGSRYEVPVNSVDGFTINVTNNYLYGRVDFFKFNADKSKYLSGAEFEVRHLVNGEWVAIPNASVEEVMSGGVGTGKYKALIPLDSANETTYRIYETKAPDNYVINPDPDKRYIEVSLKFDAAATPHGNYKDFAIANAPEGTYLINTEGSPLEITKYNNVRGATNIDLVGNREIKFTLYHYNTTTSAWEEVHTAESTDGKLVFDGEHMLAPGEQYAVAETYFNHNKYTGLESIYRNNEKQTLQSITVGTKTVENAYVFTNSGNVGTIELQAYNIPYIKPVIRKLDVGQYPQGAQATMNYKVFELPAGYDTASLTDAAVTELAASTNTTDTTIPRIVASGETTNAVTTTLDGIDGNVLGTTKTWETDTLANRWDPNKTYILVETKVGAKNAVYDTMVKDDPRVTWYTVIDPVENPDPDNAPVFTLKNINGVAGVTLEKNVVEQTENSESDVVGGKVGTLLESDRNVVYTITPHVTGKNQMLKSFALEEVGLTAGNPEAPDYTINKIIVGSATQIVPAALELASATIKADVYWYKNVGGDTVPEAERISNGQTLDVEFGTQISAPEGTKSFVIVYRSPEIVAKTDGAYTLAEELNVAPATVFMTVKEIPESKENPATEITQFTNKAKTILKYTKWKDDGSGTEEVKVDPDATAVVDVEPVQIPFVSVAKTSDTDTAVAGSVVKYTLTVTNKSTSKVDFEDPLLVDILPTGLKYYDESGYEPVVSNGSQGEPMSFTSISPMEGVQRTAEVDGQSFTDSESCIAFQLDGNLKPGSSVTVDFYAMVNPGATAYDQSSAVVRIRNDVYLSSPVHTYHTTTNPNGYSFAVSQSGNTYNFGQSLEDAANRDGATSAGAVHFSGVEGRLDREGYTNEEDYRWVAAKDEIPVVIGNALNLSKAVQGDQDSGFHDTGLGVATRTNSEGGRPDFTGWVKWRLLVNNGQTEAAKNVTVGDVIPKVNDDPNRNSKWDVIFDQFETITMNGVDITSQHYTVYYYTGSIETAVSQTKSAMRTARTWTTPPENWSATVPANKENITAFVIVFDSTVQITAGHTGIITYNTNVKDYPNDVEFNGGTDNDGTVYPGIAFENATNNFYVYYSGYSLVQESNPVSVTLLDSMVEVQGDVWIDEDLDDTQQSTGNRRNYSDYAIIRELANSISFSITDLRSTAHGNTIGEDDDHGTNVNPGYGESIRHFTFTNLGPAIKVRDPLYTADHYLNAGAHKLGQQGALKGTDPYHYSINALISDASLMNIFKLSGIGSGHYMSDNPDTELSGTAANSLDNNFNVGEVNTSYSTYPFYLRYSNLVDQSKDIGFQMFRQLELTKVAQDNENVKIEGAKFSVYGPFEDTSLGISDHTPASGSALKFSGTKGNYTLDPDGTVTVLETDANGKIVINGLNWWKEYDVKEITAAPGYTISGATATADASVYTQITDRGNGVFTLKVPGKAKTNETDKVTVKDPREVEIPLQVEKFLETVADRDYTFQYELRLTTDPNGQNSTLVAKDPIQTIPITVHGSSTGTAKETGAFTPVKVNGAGTYVFSITEKAPTPLPAGWTYDANLTKTATVVVKWDDTAKALVVDSITYSDPVTEGEEPDQQTYEKFTNKYEKTGTWTPEASKSLNGRPIVAGEFAFTVKEGTKTVSTGTVNANGSITFTPIAYTLADVGTHNYVITENSGSAAGVTYSTQSIEVTVVVADDPTKDELTVTATYPATKTFINTFRADGTWTPKVFKILNGRDMNEGETFTVTVKNGDATVMTGTVTAGRNGQPKAFTFDPAQITYTQANLVNFEPTTFTYTITETRGNAGGVTYSTASYTVDVTIALHQNADGTYSNKLDVTDNMPDDGYTFINKYKPEPIPATPKATKSLTGEPTVTESKFTFELTADTVVADGAYLTSDLTTAIAAGRIWTKEVTIPAGQTVGTISFDEITYTKAGTYVYTIKEKDGGNANFTYDGATWTYTVVVTDNKQGNLVVSETYKSDAEGSEAQTTPAAFVNNYHPTPAEKQLEVEKILTGEPLYDAENTTFTFTLSFLNGPADGYELPATTQITIPGSAVEAGNGTALFDAIKFSKAGTYNFKIVEEAGTSPKITYDPTNWNVEIVVKDQAGTLTVISTTYKNLADNSTNGDRATFTNDYNPEDTLYIPEVRKIVTGEDRPENKETFHFTLTQKSGPTGGATLHATTATVVDEGTAQFGQIDFTKKGTYVFEIVEEPGSNGHYTYDEHSWTLTIVVRDDADGNLYVVGGDGTNPVSATNKIQYVRNDSTENDIAEFSNNYAPDPTSYKPMVEKKVTVDYGPLVADKTFHFTLEAADGNPTTGWNFASDNSKSATVTVPAGQTNKTAFFGDVINFTKAGTYTFNVKETEENAAGITYDTTVWTLTVVVSDHDNSLQVDSTTYTAGSVSYTDRAVFENPYKPAPTEYTPQVEKIVTVDYGPLVAEKIFNFTLGFVKAVDKDGNPVEAGYTIPENGNKAQLTIPAGGTNGTVDFGEITFVKAGTYTFEAKETAEDEEGITYDATVWTLTLKVVDHDNDLQVDEVTYVAGDKTSTTQAAFTNPYKPEPTDYVPPVVKRIIGEPTVEDLTFNFTLEANEDYAGAKVNNGSTSITVPAGQTGEDIEGHFEKIDFTMAGTYSFTVKETKEDLEGITYDETVYTLTVVVEDKDGYLEVVSAVFEKPAAADSEGGEPTEAEPETEAREDALFINAYQPTPPSTTPDRPTIVHTGDDTNVLPLLLVMGISGLLLLALGIYGVKNRKRERGGV